MQPIMLELFSYNRAMFGGVLIGSSVALVTVKDTQFLNNFGNQFGVIRLSTQITYSFENCKFINNGATGAASTMILIETYPGIIKDCEFRGNYNLDKQSGLGLINLISASQAQIINSKFIDNYANYTHPGIYMTLSSVVIIDCLFENTKSLQLYNKYFSYNGNFIQVLSDSRIDINNTIFRNGRAIYFFNNKAGKSGDCIYSDNTQEEILINETFFLSEYNSNFLYLNQIGKFQMNDTILRGNQSKVGGCLYMNQDLLEKDFTPKAIEGNEQLIILNSTFKFCQAQKGGAAYFEDVQGLLIGNNSNFFYNRAFKEDSAFGGAIDFYCGSISWNYLEPIMGPRITLTRNYANIYGDNISSVAKYMTKLSTEQYNQLKIIQNDDQRRRFLQAISSELMSATNTNKDSSQIIQNQQSGGNVPNLYFALIDKYGQIVYSDQNSKLYVQVNTEVKKNENQQFSAAFEATTQYNIIDGIFNVDNLVLTATPNTTDGIDYNLPDNQQIYSDAVELQQYNVTVQLRTCLEGEELLSSGKCRSCQGPDYYLLKKTSKITNCLECQKSKSYCDGGNQVFPKANYWRSSMDSDNFISCRNPIACLGRNGKENNYLGSCRQGYQGILCIDCQLGFSRTGTTYLCSNCPDPTANAFRLIGLLTVMIMLMCFMVRSTLQGALAKKNFISVYWPEQLSEFFNFAKPVSESSTQFVSIDCFVDLRENNQDKGKQQETYVMQQSTEQTTQNQNNEVIMMKDEEIVDIQKIAKTDKKLRKKTLSGLGIPMFGFFRLYRGRLNLDKFKTKQTLGFLYNGYRNHSYYWEIIIMYRKITIIFISVFMAQSGKIVQPFANFRLNTLEQISLASSVLTVYCGIFYIADVTLTSESQFNLGEDAKLALFALIVISNAIFFGYWVTQFLQEIKTTLRSKNPLIYKYLYLCGNNRILEKEIKIQNLVEKQQDFINDIEKINDYLIEQKKVYQSGRIPQEDKDFKKAMIALQQFQKETMNKRKFNKQETTNLDNYSQVVAVRSTLRNTVKSFQQQLTEDKLIDIQELELYQNNKEQQIMLEDSMYQSSIGNTQGEDEYYQIEQEISQIYNKPVHTFENSQADLNDWSQTNAGFQLPFSQEEQKNLNQIYRNKTNKDIKERQTNFEKAHLHFQLPLEQSQQKDQNSSRFQQKLMQQHPLTFRVNLARLNEASRQYQSQEIDMVDDDLTLTSRRNLENPYRNQGQNNDSFGLPYDSKLQRNEEDDFSSGLDLLVSNLQTKRIEEDIITLQKSKETIGNAKNSRIVLRNKKKKSQNAIENLNTGTIKKKRLRKNNLNEVLEKSLTKEL
ncbi:UNKNOWN [Stylonychia lemnae]|uniref:Transmembrane protein n=1 Tax=Stylonychia lemnae TaxID=5949 RepID=A0A078A7B6_STYLE|nr:UNKNOWN [Stylonychia lemnae]|eukprot:CDW76686.1 UNKNOWN [Stylonychia lemnae]